MTRGTDDRAVRRVALVSSSYHPYFGGVEEHVRRVARELAGRGHTVEVWTVDRGEHLADQWIDGVRVRYLPTPLPAFTPGGVLRFLRDLPAAASAWRRARRGLSPDVLHVQCFGPNGVYAAVLARLTRTPLVISSHGETFADEHDVFGTTRLLPAALRWALRRARAVTGVSTVVLDDLRDRFGLRKGIVVPNGTDPSPDAGASPPLDLPSPYVFAAGRMVRVKGFDTLVRAFAAATRPGDERLVIAGDGPERAALRALGDDLGLGDALVLPGRLGHSQVLAAMAAAQVVVVPSRQEAFGLVVLEAWQSGGPVVATRSGGPTDLIVDGETGILVDVEDVTAMARSLSELLVRPDERNRLATRGHRAALAYSWARTVDAYEAVFRAASNARR